MLSQLLYQISKKIMYRMRRQDLTGALQGTNHSTWIFSRLILKFRRRKLKCFRPVMRKESLESQICPGRIAGKRDKGATHDIPGRVKQVSDRKWSGGGGRGTKIRDKAVVKIHDRLRSKNKNEIYNIANLIHPTLSFNNTTHKFKYHLGD